MRESGTFDELVDLVAEKLATRSEQPPEFNLNGVNLKSDLNGVNLARFGGIFSNEKYIKSEQDSISDKKLFDLAREDQAKFDHESQEADTRFLRDKLFQIFGMNVKNTTSEVTVGNLIFFIKNNDLWVRVSWVDFNYLQCTSTKIDTARDLLKLSSIYHPKDLIEENTCYRSR